MVNSRGTVGIIPLVIGVSSIVLVVWMVVYLGSDSLDTVTVPEDVRLTNFVIVQEPDPVWLGVDIVELGRQRQLQGEPPKGVMISRIFVDSPADKAGLLPGDVVQRVDKINIETSADIKRSLLKRKPGEAVRLKINRNGKDRTFHIRLGSNPNATFVAARTQVNNSTPWFGVDVQPVDKMMLKQFGLLDNHGVIVSWVYPNSPAEAAGIVQGDIIRRIDNNRIRDPKQMSTLLVERQPGSIVDVTLFHQGNIKDVRVALSSPPPPGAQTPPPLAEAEVEIEAAWLGLDIVPLTAAEAEELGLPRSVRGMVVDGVAAGPGTDAGFQAGDVITAINGQATPNVGAFQEATEGAVGAVVDVIRYRRHLYISIPPPGQNPAGQNAVQNVQQVAFNRVR